MPPKLCAVYRYCSESSNKFRNESWFNLCFVVVCEKSTARTTAVDNKSKRLKSV